MLSLSLSLDLKQFLSFIQKYRKQICARNFESDIGSQPDLVCVLV